MLNIELSKSIKCPSLGTFLAGMKKFQEYLSDSDHLHALCDYDLNLAGSFQSVFAKFLRLNDPDNFDKILNNPDDFVLKPQREGGGNNFYGSKIT